MELAEKDTGLAPEDLEALQEAFDYFSRQTNQLKQAYRELKEKAEQIDLELEEANRELQRKVQQLDEAYNFQSSILQSIPTAVVVTDLEGRINTLNSAAESMWGVPAGWAEGRHFREVMEPHHGLLEGVLSGRYHQEAVRRELEEDRRRIISSVACLVEDSSGRPIGAIQLDNDITRVQRLEAELRHKEKLADLGKMAAGLAHEIRKPLNGIKGFASLLERRLEEGETEQNYVGHIVGAADRLNGMLGRLLDFARPDELNSAACDLRAEAEKVVEFVRAEGAVSGADLRVRVPDAARHVRADADKLKQVLLNLVKNGLEAAEEGSPVTVAVEAERHEEQDAVRVRVKDNGRGIEAEMLQKVREPFYSDKQGGTGLGLAIVHRILQLHGSQLQVESRPGEGTQMAFLLPADGEEKAG